MKIFSTTIPQEASASRRTKSEADTQPVRPVGVSGIFSAMGKALSRLFGTGSPNGDVCTQVRAATKDSKVRVDVQAAIEQVAAQRGVRPRQSAPVKKTAANRTRQLSPNKPLSSSQSLQALIDEVWEKRNAVLQGKLKPYDMYCQVREVNELTMTPQVYLSGLASIAQNRPQDAVSNLQSLGGSGDSISDVVEMHAADELPDAGPLAKSRVEGGFFRFQRAHWQPHAILERVYVNGRSDAIPHMMSQIVQNIIDQPQRFPGVEMAKCSGPGSAGGRAENIVIYTHGGEATKRVLAEIQRIKAKRPKSFMTTTPQMTQPILNGVAIGAEPTQYEGRHSFGSVRAEALTAALRLAHEKGLDHRAFSSQVRHELARRGVDPERPHRNLPRGD